MSGRLWAPQNILPWQLSRLAAGQWLSPGASGASCQGPSTGLGSSYGGRWGDRITAVTLSPRSGGLAPAEVSGRPEPQDGDRSHLSR